MVDDRPPAAPRSLSFVTAHVRVLFAVPGCKDGDPEQPVVVLGFGDSFADAEAVAISVDDAWLLRSLLGDALDGASDLDPSSN